MRGTTTGLCSLSILAAAVGCSGGVGGDAVATNAEALEPAADRAGVAESLTHAANVLYDRGDLAGAERMDQQALVTYREIGNRGGEAGALNNVAVVLKSQGQLEMARQLYEQVLGVHESAACVAAQA